VSSETQFGVKGLVGIKQQQGSSYRHGTVAIQLAAHDADIDVILPNGQKFVLQWRVEAPSLDVCLPFNTTVCNWKGIDMKSAPPAIRGKNSKGTAHIREAGQLVIEFPEQVLAADGVVENSFAFSKWPTQS